MAWNKPGSGNDKNDKDPWTGKAKRTTPPDLEQALRELRKKLQLLVSTKRGLEPKNLPTSSPFKFNKYQLSGLLGILLSLWFAWGIYSVEPGETAIVVRLGKYITTQGPGLYWVPRFFERAVVVNQLRNSAITYNARILTQDQNLVDVNFTVHYRITDARAYLFNVANPPEMLLRAITNAANQVLGNTNLESALAVTHQQLREQLQQVLNTNLAACNLGVSVSNIAIASITAPTELQTTFADAKRAFSAMQATVAQANEENKQAEFTAHAQAQRLEAEAIAYQKQIILRAKTETAEFLALLPSYHSAPAVTRSRLYIETLETILSNTNKILVDAGHGDNNLLYLPLDKLINSTVQTSATPLLSSVVNPTTTLTVPASIPLNTNHSDFNDIGPVQGGYSQ